MTDCANAEMRDQLPDLLHERLDMATRAVVEAHVGTCADCRAELALLRETRVALTSGVRSVDMATITRVVVDRTRTAFPSVRDDRRSSWRSSFGDWRVAASIALLIVGAGVVLSRGSFPARQPSVNVGAESILTTTRTVAGSTSFATRAPVRVESTPSATSASAELSAVGEVGDLSESDIRALLHDLNGMDAVPSSDPEPVLVRVSVPGSGGSE